MRITPESEAHVYDPARAISTERLQSLVAMLAGTSPDPENPIVKEAIRRGLVTPLTEVAGG